MILPSDLFLVQMVSVGLSFFSIGFSLGILCSNRYADSQ